MSLNAPAFDIMTLLAANGFGVVGDDLFSFEWGFVDGAEVVVQVLVMDSGTLENALIKDCYEQPLFTISVRGASPEGATIIYEKARDIYQFMMVQPRTTLNGIDYLEFAPNGGLIPMGKDDNNRWIYAMNFFTYRDSVGDST